MKTYLISFETQKPLYEYPNLLNAITSLSEAFCNPLGSTWIIKSSLSSFEIFNSLIKEVDLLTDYVFVVEITNNKQGWLEKEMWDYLENTILTN